MHHPSDEGVLPASPPDRSPPMSAEAEEHVLACCWLDGNETISRAVTQGTVAESFYSPANRELWNITLDLWTTRGGMVTLQMIAEELKTRRLLEATGGFPYLMQITSKIPTTAHAGYFIEKLREKKLLRDVIHHCTDAVERAYSFTSGLDEYVARVSSGVNRALGIAEATEERIQVIAGRVADEVEKAKPEDKAPSVAWGLIDIDHMCGKMSPGELVILAGRPSTGKSALADQVAWRTASRTPAEDGGDVLMFTYEMTKRDKAVRIAQQISGINFNKLATVPAGDRARFVEACRKIRDCSQLHVFERDTAIVRLTARCRAFAARRPVKLVVIDFLQYLARLEPLVGRERTDEKIGRLTAACKDIGKELGCPVLLLSSLNREGEKEGRPPRMSDLRASGEIESDADVIALLHWPKENPLNHQAQDPHDHGQRYFFVEFNQEKGRNKGVHQAGLTFDREATKFNNAIA